VAFNDLRHPEFFSVVRATSLDRFDYEPPSYHAIRITFIEPTEKHIEIEVRKATKQFIETYGATIYMEGWNNITYRPLMNVMLLGLAGKFFVSSIDTTGNKKTKMYIAMELKKFIDEVGPNSVIQICTYNATNILGTMDDIITTYPHVFK
jgi:hypothetical protein